MRTLFIALIGLLVTVSSAPAAATSWKIDPDHAQVGFKVRHLMVSNVRGNFDKVAGTVQIDEADISRSTVNVTIDTSSVNTGIARRDEHLRSADFFDVARFPTMTFVSRKVAKAGPGNLQVTGDLTIHGVTRPVVLNVDGPTAEIKDPWGMTRRGVSAGARIDRKDFGLVWNKVLEAGGVAVGDDVEIHLEVELIKK